MDRFRRSRALSRSVLALVATYSVIAVSSPRVLPASAPLESTFLGSVLESCLDSLPSLVTVADAAEAPKQLLFVGNSFTKGVKKPLKALIKSSGRSAKISSSVGNGFTFSKHLQSSKTAKKIAKRSWDYVVLQEQSLGLYHSRYPEARVLDHMVRAAGARTMFFMTWRDRGFPLVSYDSLRGEPGEDVGYVPIAFELGAAVAPIGWAFRNALEDYPVIDLWNSDGHHAGRAGDYLAALVLYAMIYGETPVGLWGPGPLSTAETQYYQVLAEQTVFAEIDTWIPPGH